MNKIPASTDHKFWLSSTGEAKGGKVDRHRPSLTRQKTEPEETCGFMNVPDLTIELWGGGREGRQQGRRVCQNVYGAKKEMLRVNGVLNTEAGK